METNLSRACLADPSLLGGAVLPVWIACEDGPPAAGSSLAIEATATVDLAAKSGEGEAAAGALPRFSMTANTGRTPMVVDGWRHPVILDFAGLNVPSQARPIRMNHDSGQGVGHTDKIEVRDGILYAEGVISRDTPAARDVVTSSKNGFPWQASVGARADEVEFVKAGEAVTVNGAQFSGPLNVVRKSTLGEISFVDLGADGSTSARVAAIEKGGKGKPDGQADPFDAWLAAKGFDDRDALTEAQESNLRALYDVERAAPRVDPNRRQTLDDIVNAQRLEDERVDDITRITAEAIADRPALLDRFDQMAKAAIEAKTTVQEFKIKMLSLRAEVAPGAFIPKGDTRPAADVIEAAVCLTGGLTNPEKHFDARTLDAARRRFPHGLGLVELLQIGARENGHPVPSPRDIRALLRGAFDDHPGHVRAQGWSTLSLPGIFSNTANKFLVDSFAAVESTWRAITAIRSVRDFKTVTSYSLTGDMKYEKVGPGGEIKHGTLGELSYTNKAETYAKMFAITRQDIVNDDLGALTQIPRKLGRGAALALNDVFWAAFMNNSSFFTSGRGNFASGAGTALSIASLTAAETLFLNQTDPDGNPVAVMPRILLVPNALSVTANNLMDSRIIANDTTANTVTLANNPHAGKFSVVRSSYLSNTNITGNSTTAWYLLADPNDMAVIEVAFLNGKDTPTVESADADFNTLGIQFRGFHDFGVGLQEYRAGVKEAGA